MTTMLLLIGALSCLSLALFPVLGFAPSRSSAAPEGLITVTTVHDDEYYDNSYVGTGCSLREAIMSANWDLEFGGCPSGYGDDTIIVPAGRYILSAVGVVEDGNWTGDLDISSNVTLIGAGAELTVIDGNDTDRVLEVHAGARVVLNDVTITQGRSPDGLDNAELGGGDAEPGGGIRNAGELWLLSCVITENQTGEGGRGSKGTTALGGDGGDGGGIFNVGRLFLERSTVRANTAGRSGFGGDRNGEVGRAGSGGGIYNRGELSLRNSRVIQNQAGDPMFAIPSATCDFCWHAGIVGDGGGIWNGGTMTSAYSTIAENKAGGGAFADTGGRGGGIFNVGQLTFTKGTVAHNRAGNAGAYRRGRVLGRGGDGGGIFSQGTLHLSNSTLSGNQTGSGMFHPVGSYGGSYGPGGCGGGVFNTGIAELEYSTVSGNLTGGRGNWTTPGECDAYGGGVYNHPEAQLKVTGLLLSENKAKNQGPDCYGILTSQRFNLVQDAGYCILAGDDTGNVIGQAPLLAPLADNGGATWTHALLPRSPALNRTDCRGINDMPLTADQRDVKRPMDYRCDIGAYERAPSVLLPYIRR